MPKMMREPVVGTDAGKEPQAGSGGRAKMAYEYILDRLRSGAYQPGERLKTGPISDALGISRHPIMVAMQQLSNEYLIQIHPQVGCVPAVYSKDEWIEFGRYFASCEALITQIAAEKASPEDIANLRIISRDMGALLNKKMKPQDIKMTYRDINVEFHRFIHKIAKSRILDRRLVSLWNLADYYNFTVGQAGAFNIRVSLAIQEHEAICDAMTAGHANKARRLMEEHVLEQFLHGIP